MTVWNPEEDPNRPVFEFQFGEEAPKNGPKVGGNFELQFDSGGRSGIALGLWVMLTAGMLFFSYLRCDNFYSLWDCLWPTGLLVFGLFGLYPKFSFLRLGCALFGGYYIVNVLGGVFLKLNKGLGLPLFLLFFGLSILTETLHKKNGRHTHINSCNKLNELSIDGETFRCATSFGEDDHRPMLSRLSGGTAEVSFGELTLDLSGCEEIAPHCPMDLKCSFGQLNLLVPRSCKADLTAKKSFASLDIKGSPDPNASTMLHVNCDVSFGQILIRYL